MIKSFLKVLLVFGALTASPVFAHLTPAHAVQQEVKLGVLAFRPKPIIEAQWAHLAEYLNQTLPGTRFTVVALNYQELEDAVSKRQVDIVLTQPANYIYLSYKYKLSSPLATRVDLVGGHPVPEFGGVIVVQASRDDLRQLDDLKRKKIAVSNHQTFGGYLTEAYELQQAGIPLPNDEQLIETGLPQDKAVEAVLTGTADAAFVRTGLIESMLKEGKFKEGELRVLNQQVSPSIPFAVSTRLYPEWPVASLSHIDDELASKISRALLNLPHDQEVAKKISAHGFIVPMQYYPVMEVLKALRQPPFDTTPTFTFIDIWQKYDWQVVAGYVMLSAIIVLMVLLVHYNRHLQQLRTLAEAGENRLRQLSKQVPGMIYQYHLRTDGTSHYSYASDCSNILFGITPEALNENAESLCSRLHPDDVDEYRERFRKSAENMKSWKAEYRVIMPDGSVHWREGNSRPQRLEDGSILWHGIALDIDERKHLEEKLVKQAMTDSLTGLANRRSFFESAEVELARIKRGKAGGATLIMLDIDNFKRVNDTCGHGIGDQVLLSLAEVLNDTLRRDDFSGRIGGEEFAIFLPDTPAEQGLQFAERLRLKFESSPVSTGAKSIAYTVSFGFTIMDDTDDTVDVAMTRADDALYRAKNGGRNRVESVLKGV